MSYTVTVPAKSRPDLRRWTKIYKVVLVVVAYISVVALITVAQIANDRLADDTTAPPFTASSSQAF